MLTLFSLKDGVRFSAQAACATVPAVRGATEIRLGAFQCGSWSFLLMRIEATPRIPVLYARFIHAGVSDFETAEDKIGFE